MKGLTFLSGHQGTKATVSMTNPVRLRVTFGPLKLFMEKVSEPQSLCFANSSCSLKCTSVCYSLDSRY